MIPFAWSKVAYLVPLPLHAYNVLNVRLYALYSRGGADFSRCSPLRLLLMLPW